VTAPELAGRLIDQVQRFGLASASAIIDRYTAVAEAALGTDPARPLSLESEQLSDAAAQAGAAYLALLAGAGALAERSEHRPERIDLPPVAAGSATHGALFLHNGTEHPIAEAWVRIGPFLSVAGSMPAGAATIEPTDIPLAPGASAELRLNVGVPAAQPPGDYFAIALATGAEDPTVVRVEVLPRPVRT
jgi:hypothetical protein